MSVLKHVDFAFVDIKHMDPEKHREQTHVSNQQILENVMSLAGDAWKGRLVVRIPIIPGFNDDDENIIATANFVKNAGLGEINVLPFHRMGDSKWRQCGMVYPYSEQESPTPEQMAHIRGLVSGQGIVCYTGSDTPF